MISRMLKVAGKLILLSAGLAVAIFLLLVLYSAVIYPLYLKSQAGIGMDRKDVLDNLQGNEYSLSETLSLCESNAWHGDCAAATSSNSVEYLTLKTGVDTWLVVGFDSNGKVSFVGLGDT